MSARIHSILSHHGGSSKYSSLFETVGIGTLLIECVVDFFNELLCSVTNHFSINLYDIIHNTCVSSLTNLQKFIIE